MKTITIDLDEVSESRELYNSKPCSFCVVFIYLMILFVVIAIVWASIFKVDVVVKGNGIVDTIEKNATVTNVVAGELHKSYVVDGQEVKEGDILYSIATPDLDIQISHSEETKQEYEKQLEIMNAYLSWLQDENYDFEQFQTNPYYFEYASRKNVIMINIASTYEKQDNEKKTYESAIASNENMLVYYKKEIESLNHLINGIKIRTNIFSPSDNYYYAKLEEYISGYKNTEAQYDNSISSIQSEINKLEKTIKESNELINEYSERIACLKSEVNVLQQSIDNININEDVSDAAEEVAISEDSISVEELQGEIQRKRNEIASFENQKQSELKTKENLEELLSENKSSLETTELQEKISLENMEKEAVAEAQASIASYEQPIISLANSTSENLNALSDLANSDYLYTQKSVIQTEINAVALEISTYQDKLKEEENSLQKLLFNKEKADVEATTSGFVNLSIEMKEGNYIREGEDVLTIIPHSESGFVVKSYINNKDIAKIKSGMTTKYEIAAYPSNEFGSFCGEVVFVSSDLKTSMENGSAYYVIESNLENVDVYNQSGEKAELKVGMYCETKIVIEQKTVMELFLEKLKLWEF